MKNLRCTRAIHTRYRSLLGQKSLLQIRIQFQCCCKISRSASKAASPTIGDVKALNKLARQLKSQPVKLQFWPLTGPLRKGMTVFLAEPRERSSRDGITYVLLTIKIRRLKRMCSLQPWQNCTHSWQVLVHANFFVDYKWTCQVRLQKFTWGLARRTWWQQQEHIYLNIRKQSTGFQYCKRKLVQGIFMILHIFQLRIVWQIVWRKHQERQTTWSHLWKIGRLSNVDIHPNLRTLKEHKAFLSTWCRTCLHTREQDIFFLLP